MIGRFGSQMLVSRKVAESRHYFPLGFKFIRAATPRGPRDLFGAAVVTGSRPIW
jgi:hypothetical protein